MNIKIFSDFACPFCYIGLAIVKRLKEEEANIEFQWIPYILRQNAPLEGRDLLNRISKEDLDKSYKRIEGLGLEYNLIYNNKRKGFNTNKLHKAALYAEKEGKYYEFAERAFKAIFEYGKNVAKKSVINDLALKSGLNIDEMNNYIKREEVHDYLFNRAKNLAEKYEIDSVPTFIVDDSKKVYILKDYENFKRDLLDKGQIIK